MHRPFNPRRIVVAYMVVGLLIGTCYSGWCFRHNFGVWYRDTDGSLTRTFKPGVQVGRIDTFAGEVRVTEVGGTRKITLVEKFGLWLLDALPFLLASSAVGLFWGFTHLKIRAAMRDTFGDENRIDYDDSINEYRPPTST